MPPSCLCCNTESLSGPLSGSLKLNDSLDGPLVSYLTKSRAPLLGGSGSLRQLLGELGSGVLEAELLEGNSLSLPDGGTLAHALVAAAAQQQERNSGGSAVAAGDGPGSRAPSSVRSEQPKFEAAH